MNTRLEQIGREIRSRLAPYLEQDLLLRLLLQRFGREPEVPRSALGDLLTRRGPRRTYQDVLCLALLNPGDDVARAAFTDGLNWLGRRAFSSTRDTLSMDALGQFALAVGTRSFGLPAPWLVSLAERRQKRARDDWALILTQASLVLLERPLDPVAALPCDVVATLLSARLLEGPEPRREDVLQTIAIEGECLERLALRTGALGWLWARLKTYLPPSTLEQVIDIMLDAELASETCLRQFLRSGNRRLGSYIIQSGAREVDQLRRVLTELNSHHCADQIWSFLYGVSLALKDRSSRHLPVIEPILDELSWVIEWQKRGAPC